MSRATELENAKRIAKWKADQYFELGIEDLDWVANELVRIEEELKLLQRRQAELWAKHDQLRAKTARGLDAMVAAHLAKAAKPKPMRRL